MGKTYEMLQEGQRLKRRDSKVKQLASRFANWLRNAILHDETRDTGCGLKAIHTDVLRKLPFFDGTHRFVPALVIQEGYRVVHCDVVDRSRRHGKSNYGNWGETIVVRGHGAERLGTRPQILHECM